LSYKPRFFVVPSLAILPPWVTRIGVRHELVWLLVLLNSPWPPPSDARVCWLGRSLLTRWRGHVRLGPPLHGSVARGQATLASLRLNHHRSADHGEPLSLPRHFYPFVSVVDHRCGLALIVETVVSAATMVGRARVLFRVAIRLLASPREPRVTVDSLDWPARVLGAQRGCQVPAGATSSRAPLPRTPCQKFK
jgi:hypothetical protein